MAYYSGNGIDVSIEPLMPEFGYAVDVGANDGKLFSNSLFLEEKGWMVLCVEPNPLLEAEGRLARRLWRQVAAGSADGEAEFWANGGHPYASDSRIGLGSGQKFQVKVLTLDRIIEESGFPRVDFLTVDAESWEPQIMAGFTVERWKPRVIVLESWSVTPSVEVPGYERTERREFDNVWVRNEG